MLYFIYLSLIYCTVYYTSCIDRGVSSIVSILSSVLFDVIPTLVDIAIAVVYFTYAFDIFFGMIVFVTMSLYLVSTIIMTEWRTKYRRLTNLLDNAMESKAGV